MARPIFLAAAGLLAASAPACVHGVVVAPAGPLFGSKAKSSEKGKLKKDEKKEPWIPPWQKIIFKAAEDAAHSVMDPMAGRPSPDTGSLVNFKLHQSGSEVFMDSEHSSHSKVEKPGLFHKYSKDELIAMKKEHRKQEGVVATPTLPPQARNLEMYHFVPDNGMVCIQGAYDYLDYALIKMRLSPLGRMYVNTTLQEGRCKNNKYEKGPYHNTCWVETTVHLDDNKEHLKMLADYEARVMDEYSHLLSIERKEAIGIMRYQVCDWKPVKRHQLLELHPGPEIPGALTSTCPACILTGVMR